MFLIFLKLKKFKFHKQWLSLGVLILSFIFLIFPRGVAHAGAGGWFASLFLSLLGLILYVLAVASTFILGIGSKLLSFVMTTTFNHDLFIGAPFVKVAWSFTRDFANLFFILWLVIIALATIVDVKGYSAKKLLVKLIIVALLVNFSLVLCGFMLDIAQGAMGFLTQSVIVIKGEPFSLADGLSYSFRQSELFGARPPSGSSFFLGNLDASISAVMQNLLVLAFSLIAAYVFLILAIMLLVRVVALWLLLIFAPLAWTFGIMPFAKKALTEWISKFFQWAFYGVIVAFLMYLAAMAVWAIQGAKGWSDNLNQGSEMMGGFGTQVSFMENFTSILSFIVVIVLLLMAKGVAMSAAKNGGDMVTGAIAGYVGGKAATWGKKPVKWAGRKTREKTDKLKTKTKGKIGDAMMKYSTFPGGGVIARKGANWKNEELRRQRREKREHKDYSLLNEDQRKQLALKAKGPELEALMEEMMKGDEIYNLDKNNGEDEKILEKMYKYSQHPDKEKLLKEFMSKRIDMVASDQEISATQDPTKKAKLEKNRQEAIKKAMKNNEFENWTQDMVENLPYGVMREISQDRVASKKMASRTSDLPETVQKEILQKIQSDFEVTFDKKDLNTRELYANMSGDYHTAYNTDMNGAFNRPAIVNNPKREEIIAKQISKIRSSDDWEKLDDSDENLGLIARHIQSSQINNAGRNLDSYTKAKIYDELGHQRHNSSLDPSEQKDRTEVYKTMMYNDTWPGSNTGDRLEKLRKHKEERDKKKEEMNKMHGEALQMNKEYDKAQEEKQQNEKKEMNKMRGEAIEENKLREKEKEAKKIEERDKKQREEKEKERLELEKQRLGIEKEKLEMEKQRQSEKNDKKDKDDGDNGGGSYQKKPTPPTGIDSGGEAQRTPSPDNKQDYNIRADKVNIQPDNTLENGNTKKVNLNQKNISISEGANAPNQTVDLRGKESRIITPESPRAHRKYEQTSGFLPYRMTPQQKKDFEEKKQRKRQEAMEKKQKTKLSSQHLNRVDAKRVSHDSPEQARPQGQYTSPKVLGDSTTIHTGKMPEKSKISQEGEQDLMDNNLMKITRAQAQNGEIEEAVKGAQKIQDSEKKGYALWSIAATQAQKGNFSEALRIARQIDHDKIRSLAIDDLEHAKERTPESYS